MTPSLTLEYDNPVASVIGSASMSPRNARRPTRSPAAPELPEASPMSTISPVLGNMTGSRPAARNLSATNCVVECSMCDNSGWACRCRRHAST